MKFATYNANSVRVRLPILLDWLAHHEPDVLALQETKCEDKNFPADAFSELGYHSVFHGQKSYNGVATLSRSPIQQSSMGFGDPAWPNDCRILTTLIDGIIVLNTYVPNGTKVGSEKWAYKLQWLENLRDHIQALLSRNMPFVWMGDINIAPTPDDVYESERKLGEVGHHPDEFTRLAAIRELGLTDVFRKYHQGPGHYTYWDFFIKNAFERKLGWRIDHIYANDLMAGRCSRCEIDTAPRLVERPSDHTFVVAEFD